MTTWDARTKPVATSHEERAPEEIEYTIWKIAEWLRRLVEERQTTVTEVMETMRQAEVWISSLEHHHGSSSGSTSKNSKTTHFIFKLLLPVLLSVQRRYLVLERGNDWAHAELHGSMNTVSSSTSLPGEGGDESLYPSEDDYGRIGLTETGTLQLDWCLDAAVHECEGTNCVLAYGVKLAHGVADDDSSIVSSGSGGGGGGGTAANNSSSSMSGKTGNASGLLFGSYISPRELFGADTDVSTDEYRNTSQLLDVIAGVHSSDSYLTRLRAPAHLHTRPPAGDGNDVSTSSSMTSSVSAKPVNPTGPDAANSVLAEAGTNGAANACLELLSATSLPLMVERLMGRLQAFPLHLTLLYVSSSWHFTVINPKQRHATVAYLSGVCEHVIKHVERGAQRRTIMNILTKIFTQIRVHAYANAREWLKIPTKDLDAFWLVQQRIYAQAKKWARRKNSRIEAASLMQQLVSFSRLGTSQLKQRAEVLDTLRHYVETVPALRPASLQLIARFMIALTSSDDIFETLPSDVWQRDFTRFLLLVCPEQPKKEPSLCEILPSAGVIAAAARSSGEKALDGIKRLLTSTRFTRIYRTLGLSALAIIVSEWRIDETLKRKADEIGVIVYEFLTGPDYCLSHAVPALRSLRLLLQMDGPGAHRVIHAVGRLVASTLSSKSGLSRVAHRSMAACLAWIPRSCLMTALHYCIKALGRDPMCSQRKFIDLINSSRSILRRLIEMIELSSRDADAEAVVNTRSFRSTWIPLRLKMEGIIVLSLSRQEAATRTAIFEFLYLLNSEQLRGIESAIEHHIQERRARVTNSTDAWCLDTYNDAYTAVQSLAQSLRCDAVASRRPKTSVPFLADTLEPLLEFVKRCVTPTSEVCDGALMAILTGDGLFLHQISVQWAWRRLSKIAVWSCIPTNPALLNMWKRMVTIVFTPMRANRRSPRLSTTAGTTTTVTHSEGVPPLTKAEVAGSEGTHVSGDASETTLVTTELFVDANVLTWLSRNRMSMYDGVPLAVSGAWKVSQMSSTPVGCSEALVLALSGLDVSLTDILVLELRSSATSFDTSSPRAPVRRSTLLRRKSKLSVWEQEIQLAESIRSSFHYNLNVLSVLANIFSRLSADDYWSDEIALHRASRTCLEELVGIWLKQTSADVLRFVPIRTRIAIMTLVRCYLCFMRMKPSTSSSTTKLQDDGHASSTIATTSASVPPTPTTEPQRSSETLARENGTVGSISNIPVSDVDAGGRGRGRGGGDGVEDDEEEEDAGNHPEKTDADEQSSHEKKSNVQNDDGKSSNNSDGSSSDDKDGRAVGRHQSNGGSCGDIGAHENGHRDTTKSRSRSATNGDTSMTPSEVFLSQQHQHTTNGPFVPPSLEYRESVIRTISELWAMGPHIDIDSTKETCTADETLLEQLMEGVLNVYEAVVCLGNISDISLRERIHNFIRKQILSSSRRETQAAASSALTSFLINNPSHLSHFVVGSLEVLRKHASWSAGTELEQTLVYEHLRAIVRAAQAGKLTSSWSDTGTGYALLLLHLSAPILRHRRAALDLLSVLQRHDMMEDKVHQKGVSLQSARAAMLDSEYVSDAAYVEGSAIIADLISQMRPELAPAVLRELVRMQRLFSPQILPSLLAVAIPWASALKDLISPRANTATGDLAATSSDRRSMFTGGNSADGDTAGAMESELTEEAQEVLDSAFALTSGCGIPPRHSGMLRSLWTGMINNSGHSGGAAPAKVLVAFLLQLRSMSTRNGKSWHEVGDTASVVLTLLLHSPMAMSIVRFLVSNLPHYGLDTISHTAVHDHIGKRALARLGSTSTTAAPPGGPGGSSLSLAEDNHDDNEDVEDDEEREQEDYENGSDDNEDLDEEGEGNEIDNSENCDDEKPGAGLSVVTSKDELESYADGAIWGGVRELRSFDTNQSKEKADVVFFLLKAAAHTHAKLLVPQLHFILHYAAVQTHAQPENGHEAAVFLIRVLHLLVLRSKLRSGTEEVAWSFIKSYLNDLWGSDDLAKHDTASSMQSSAELEQISTSLEFRFTSTVVMRLSEALEDACPTLKWNWNVLALSGATHAETRPEVLASLTIFAGLGGAQTLEQLMQLARIIHVGVLTGEEEVVVKAVEGLSETFDSDTKGALVGASTSDEEQILQIRPFWDLALGIAVALLTSGSMRLYRAAVRLALRLLRLTHLRTISSASAEEDNGLFSPSRGGVAAPSRVLDDDEDDEDNGNASVIVEKDLRRGELHGDDDAELALAPQDTRLVVMFGICPVVSIPPDVLLATLVERGLFSLFPGTQAHTVDVDGESSSLAIHLLRELWDVSSEAGDVDNYLMVLEIVVTSLRIVENLFRHSKTIELTNPSDDEKRTSNALGRARDAAHDAVALIKRSGFAMDDMMELFAKTSEYAAAQTSPTSSAAATSSVAVDESTETNFARAPTAVDFCADFIKALCLSLPQSATWKYILSVLLQMVQSGPENFQYPSLVMIPVVLREKMHIWSTDDFATLATTMHNLSQRIQRNGTPCGRYSRGEFSYHIDSIRLLLFTHADRTQAIDVFNIINEVSTAYSTTNAPPVSAGGDRRMSSETPQTPSEFSYKRRGGHAVALEDCSRSIWENFVFAVTENGDHVCTPTYKPKYFGFADRDQRANDGSNVGTAAASPSGTMDSSRHNSLYNSSSVGAEDMHAGTSKENSIRERSDSNTGEFDTPASSSPVVKGIHPYPYGENMHFPHVDKYGSLRLGTMRLKKAFALDAASLSAAASIDFIDDDDDDVYEMESALGRAPA